MAKIKLIDQSNDPDTGWFDWSPEHKVGLYRRQQGRLMCLGTAYTHITRDGALVEYNHDAVEIIQKLLMSYHNEALANPGCVEAKIVNPFYATEHLANGGSREWHIIKAEGTDQEEWLSLTYVPEGEPLPEKYTITPRYIEWYNTKFADPSVLKPGSVAYRSEVSNGYVNFICKGVKFALEEANISLLDPVTE